jgi:hypothetical protein
VPTESCLHDSHCRHIYDQTMKAGDVGQRDKNTQKKSQDEVFHEECKCSKDGLWNGIHYRFIVVGIRAKLLFHIFNFRRGEPWDS